MGPVSAFGFSVCGWGAIRGAGLEGRRATAAAAPRALRWGWGAGQQQGRQRQEQGTGQSIAAWQGWEGSVYPVAPLLGPGDGGDWPTEGRGQRRAPAIKKGCLAPCSGPAAPTPHPCAWACSLARFLLPWAWPAGPWMWGGGPHGAGTAGEVSQV